MPLINLFFFAEKQVDSCIDRGIDARVSGVQLLLTQTIIRANGTWTGTTMP